MVRSEEKSKKRRSPSISEDEGERKKHRTRDDRERKSSDKKKRKDKSKKSHKHSRNHDDKGTKSAEKRDRKRSKSSTHVDSKELSSDDYFSKNNEFSTWLKEEKGCFFSELSSEDARKMFSSFVKDWNSKKLHSRYYEGITSGPRTAHNWKIRSEKDL